jgi:hypothetical protein
LVTKDDRKMAPGTELFVSMGRLREQSPEAWKILPGVSHTKNINIYT